MRNRRGGNHGGLGCRCRHWRRRWRRRCSGGHRNGRRCSCHRRRRSWCGRSDGDGCCGLTGRCPTRRRHECLAGISLRYRRGGNDHRLGRRCGSRRDGGRWRVWRCRNRRRWLACRRRWRRSRGHRRLPYGRRLGRRTGLGFAVRGCPRLALFARCGVAFCGFLLDCFLLSLLAAAAGDDRADLRRGRARLVDGGDARIVLTAGIGRRQAAAGRRRPVGPRTNLRALRRGAAVEHAATRHERQRRHADQPKPKALAAARVLFSLHRRHPLEARHGRCISGDREEV